MRKLRLALVILLLLAYFAASQVSLADKLISPKSLGDTVSIGQSRATLDSIQKKLASGNNDIALNQQMLDANARILAAGAWDLAAKNTKPNKTTGTMKPTTTVKPTTSMGMTVPTSGIGDALTALGNINVNIKTPAMPSLKNMVKPKLVVLK